MPPETLLRELAAVPGLTIKRDASLAEMTTLRLGGRPLATALCATTQALARALEIIDAASAPALLLGGGSNLVVADGDLDLIAVAARCAGVEIDKESGRVIAEAGVVFDELVARTVSCGLGGLECLSGIPGSVGATPVQNVGAYGAEVADCLTRVLLWDRESGEQSWVPAADLDLGYRYSNLKFTHRAAVLAVEFQLSSDGLSRPLRFGALARALRASKAGQRFPVSAVREAVLGLRRGKGMVLNAADHDTWSAGSFFTNPVVSASQAEGVAEKTAAREGAEIAAAMPRYPAQTSDGSAAVKLSAAWLIEHAGFTRGYPGEQAPARVSTKHTLALTNRGAATTADLVALAREVRAGVAAAFGVELRPEPVWVGVSIDEPA